MVQFFDKNGDPQLDPYEILSLPQSATDAQIKKAYRMQMLQLHPDKLSPTLTEVQIEQITEQFHNVKDAYEFLISPVYLTSRRMYMTKLSARRAEYERKEAYILDDMVVVILLLLVVLLLMVEMISMIVEVVPVDTLYPTIIHVVVRIVMLIQVARHTPNG